MVGLTQVKKRRGSKNRLHIWVNGIHVAVWEVTPTKGSSLTYVDDYTLSPYRRALSLSLPLLPKGASHQGEVVDNYFNNLLPDNEQILNRIQTKYAATSKKSFDLLKEIGRDCVGAIQLLPEGDVPGGIDGISATPLKEKEVEEILKNTVTANIVPDDDDFRISIAGAQEKTALLWHNNQWHLPHGATPTSHIFKLPLGRVGNMDADFSSSVENEWLCSEIANAYGIKTAKTKIQHFGSKKALVVERFDRKMSIDGTYWIRLPQEDFCQINGLHPNFKYEKDGGPHILSIIETLKGSITAEEDCRTFIKSQILFWMLAATDGHGKNFSVFNLESDNYMLTPLYDILSAWPIIGSGANHLAIQKAKLAMSLRGKSKHYHIANIQRRHFKSTAKLCGIENSEDIIDEMTCKTSDVIQAMKAQLPDDFPAHVSNPVFEGLQCSSDKLASMKT